jgi:hypothetical protein
MTTVTFTHKPARDRAPLISEFEPPPYALREMPSDLPKDEIGREIALLLSEHPDIVSQFGSINPNALPLEAKAEMLTSIKSILGIQPVRGRHLGYVGP